MIFIAAVLALGLFAAFFAWRIRRPIIPQVRLTYIVSGIFLIFVAAMIFWDLPYYLNHPDGVEMTGLIGTGEGRYVSLRGTQGKRFTFISQPPRKVMNISPQETVKIRYLPLSGIVLSLERTYLYYFFDVLDEDRLTFFDGSDEYIEIYTADAVLIIITLVIPFFFGVFWLIFKRINRKDPRPSRRIKGYRNHP